MTRRSLVMLGLYSPVLASSAQESGNRKSPHETVSVNLGDDKITISYGRPYLKGRHLGDSMAPYGKVWRLGADEATKITVSQVTVIGNTPKLQPGSYSLFAIMHPDKWTIIVDKVADQWGAFSYEQSQDLARFDLKVQPTPSAVEQFTISLTKESASSGKLTMAWDKATVETTLAAK